MCNQNWGPLCNSGDILWGRSIITPFIFFPWGFNTWDKYLKTFSFFYLQQQTVVTPIPMTSTADWGRRRRTVATQTLATSIVTTSIPMTSSAATKTPVMGTAAPVTARCTAAIKILVISIEATQATLTLLTSTVTTQISVMDTTARLQQWEVQLNQRTNLHWYQSPLYPRRNAHKNHLV